MTEGFDYRKWRKNRTPYTGTRKGKRQTKLWLLVRDPHCYYCRAFLTMQTATIEHLKPVSKGGADTMDNLALACECCNKEKGNRWNETDRTP